MLPRPTTTPATTLLPWMVALLLGSGCGLLLDVAPPSADGPLDATPTDAGGTDAKLRDALADAPDSSPPDAHVGDAGRVEVRPLPPCGAEPDEATVALYEMNDLPSSQLTDATGRHSGFFMDGLAETTTGPDGCGPAFFTPELAFAVIPHSPEFHLVEGSVDFWIRPGPAGGSCAGLLSRDASGQANPGHFTFYRTGAGRVGIRMQSSPESRGELFFFSNASVPDDAWVHIGANFGPSGVTLFVNGVAQSGTDPGNCSTAGAVCTRECTTSIEGNDNPWVVGAASTISDEGSALPVTRPFHGALDEVRISRTHRDFAGASYP